jgi:hypothetical protein
MSRDDLLVDHCQKLLKDMFLADSQGTLTNVRADLFVQILDTKCGHVELDEGLRVSR